jgi:eukaryotic-like serine/threonine-protein kinase
LPWLADLPWFGQLEAPHDAGRGVVTVGGDGWYHTAVTIDDPERTRVSVVDPLVGVVIDRRYRIEVRLAAGGFGAIYRAIHVINRRPVALKVLHASLATEPDVVARFRREAKALGQLRSPHTITAYDFGETGDGTLYIVMELLQGETLYERFCALGPLPWRQLVAIARQVCSSLAEAHALGIVHRDLKPTNIHLEEVGGNADFVKVLDFGIAKILHGSALDNDDLTRAGQMVGTFDYMAPEQMVGGPTTGQSDIYTLGLVMYEMLTGERPFGDPETPTGMLTAMLSRVPPPPSRYVASPPELDDVIARCLARAPDKRFRDILELANALDDLVADDLDGTRTVRVPTRATTEPPEDSLTWVDGVPEPPESPPHGVPAVDPMTTLPGVGPPSRNSAWPLVDPRKKR